MRLEQLTITLADPDGRLSLKSLTAALENALDMLRLVEANFVGSDVEVTWNVVSVKMKSPLQMTFEPNVKGPRLRASKRQSIGKKIVKACMDGIEQIERAPTMPPHFDEESLKAARQLVKSMGNGVLKVSSNGKGKREVKLTDQAITHIDEITTRARTYRDVGTVEGRLEEISVHGTPEISPQIRIWDPIPTPGRTVKCVISDDRLPEAKELLGQRVAVTGPIHYRNHKPISIEVQTIRPLRTRAELPQLEDMEPIDITGDLSPEEYIRRLRDGE